MFNHVLCLVCLLFTSCVGAFNLYPSVDDVSLATAFGISIGCLDALNTTVNCDQTLFQMANTVDSYWWETDNVTALCTGDCLQSTQNWWSAVENSCENDTISAYGKMIPAASIADRYAEGFEIACLKPTTVLGGFSSNSSRPAAASSTSSWCLIDSQNWIGSDIIRPDCPAIVDNSTDPSCTDPTVVSPANERIANLYDESLLCSDCFLKMFYLRMTSAYLPDSDYSDYLVVQYQDMLDICGASVTNFTIRALPYYQDAPGTYNDEPIASNTTITNGTTLTNGTSACPGQIITRAGLANVPNFNNVTGCNAISTTFGISSNELRVAIDDYFCAPSLPAYCLAAPCSVHLVSANETCDSIAASISTTNFTVTAIQIQTWNPKIGGFCDNLDVGDYICTSAPGGSYVPPLVSNSTTDADAQQRGGGDGSNADPPGSGNSTTAPAAPTQAGIISTCNAYFTTPVTGASCAAIENLFLITFAQFYAWNPAVGSNCESLWASEAYCVGIPGSKSTTSITTSTTSTSNIVPGPTQTGIISTCNKYYLTPASGSSCAAIESLYTITFAQFLAWNPAVGSNCQNLWLGEAYCVGASSSAPTSTTTTAQPTTTSTGISIPGPTQTGIVASCNKYAVTPATGASCASLESQYSITFSQLYAWNPALGSNCQNLWESEAYCVGIAIPGPTQAGITTACAKYYVTPASGASCTAIESLYGITFAQFLAWNPAVGSNCQSLWASEAYCVAI